MRRLILGGFALMALLSLVPATPVLAHASLQSSLPAASSVLQSGPERIVLDFDESIEATTASVELFDQTDHRIPLGAAVRSASDDTVVSATVPQISDGTYAVVWRVSSVDGHVVDGAFSFQVGNSSAIDGDALVQQAREGVQSPQIVRWLYGVGRMLGYLGFAVLIGGGLMVLVATGLSAPRITRLLRAGWTLAFIGSVMSCALYGVTIVAGDLRDAFSTSVWGDIGDTRTGQMFVLRLGLVLGVGVLVATVKLAANSWWKACALIATVAIVLTFALAGHASTLHPVPLWVAISAVHTFGVFIWLGGLITISAAGGSWVAADEHKRAIDRFSVMSSAAIPLIVGTGVIETLKLAGGIGDVTATTWGRLLLVKVAVVVMAVSIGGVSRWLLQHHGAASIRRTVMVEAVMGVVILGLAAGLVALPPRPAEQSKVFSASLTQAGLIADVTVTPGRIGANEVHLVFTPAGGGLQPVVSVQGRMTLPSKNIPESPITLKADGANHYTGKITLPFAGDWTMQLVVEVTPGNTLLLSATVPVP